MISFDLISDLHIETWPNFDWSYRATSPICIIAGDVAQDRQVLKNTLEHLSQQYQAVMYIDGNDEHKADLNNIDSSYRSLKRQLKNIKGMTEGDKQLVTGLTKNYEKTLNHGAVYLKEAYGNLKELYDDVYKNAKPEDIV